MSQTRVVVTVALVLVGLLVFLNYRSIGIHRILTAGKRLGSVQNRETRKRQLIRKNFSLKPTACTG